MLRGILKIVLPSIVAGCQTLPLSGNGTGTDAGEARVIGSALLPGNAPAGNVTVTLRRQQYIPFSLPLTGQKKVFTDARGAFTIDNIEPGHYYLIELSRGDSLCAGKRFYIPENGMVIDLGEIMIGALSSYSGTILDNGSPATGSRLLVMGMDRSAEVAANGAFSLMLPGGLWYLFRIESGSAQPHDFLFSESDNGTTLDIGTIPSTLFEDFNRPDSTNNLHPLIGGGWWFAFTDSMYGGTSRIVPASDLGLTGSIDTTPDAYAGSSLHVTYLIDSLFWGPYALVGADICESNDSGAFGRSWFDMRKMYALTFTAKGSGTVFVQFTSRYNTYTFPFEVPVKLTPEWKKYVITASSIPDARIPNTSITVPWSIGAAMVNDITFLAKKNAELWLDDIIIEGMTPADFVR